MAPSATPLPGVKTYNNIVYRNLLAKKEFSAVNCPIFACCFSISPVGPKLKGRFNSEPGAHDRQILPAKQVRGLAMCTE